MKKPPLSNDILCDITKCSVIIRVNLRNPAIENIISAMENNLLYYFFLGGVIILLPTFAM